MFIYFIITIQNDADPIYSKLLVGVGILQLIFCLSACYIHHKSWKPNTW